ncbi:MULTISPECIES: hypothetical protein [Cellulophaga]|uniref:hypothetical protein n=1 Tax=Cellulophaga TaxID=104264 RepID=UPI001C06BC8B|nr:MULTISPECIES: hypothetical protein [Cellulophaga]MDO6768016.1 hypothetical protein [Cellulophaga sp. 1_MG-2023]
METKSEKIYNGIYDELCGLIIDEKGKWLIYANYNSDNLIEITVCGITRSFKRQEYNVFATRSPEPLSPNENKSKSKAEKKSREWKLRTKSDLENEIIDLKKRIDYKASC